MAEKSQHDCEQNRLIDWDGTTDRTDVFRPEHVHANLALYADIDEVLAKPMRRITPELLECGNRYIRFIREQPPFPDAESLLAACSHADDFHETLVYLQPVHARARYRPRRACFRDTVSTRRRLARDHLSDLGHERARRQVRYPTTPARARQVAQTFDVLHPQSMLGPEVLGATGSPSSSPSPRRPVRPAGTTTVVGRREQRRGTRPPGPCRRTPGTRPSRPPPPGRALGRRSIAAGHQAPTARIRRSPRESGTGSDAQQTPRSARPATGHVAEHSPQGRVDLQPRPAARLLSRC